MASLADYMRSTLVSFIRSNRSSQYIQDKLKQIPAKHRSLLRGAYRDLLYEIEQSLLTECEHEPKDASSDVQICVKCGASRIDKACADIETAWQYRDWTPWAF